jgi:uncharacterized phage protein (TIGR01671 family)
MEKRGNGRMREILFRGKHEDTNEWMFGSLHIQNGEIDGYQDLEYRILGLSGTIDYVIPETLGQFTGLTDKNGTKIFEGDIVKYGDTINKVVFEQRNGTAYFGVVMDNTETWYFCHLISAAGMEIIGNIHDNPELLGGGEK